MFHFGSSDDEEHFYVLYDICSSNVGVALVASQNGVREIVWSKRVEFGYKSVDDYNHYIRTMYATLLEMGMKMVGEGIHVLRERYKNFSAHSLKVFCILGQPWFFGSVTTEVCSRESPFQITQVLLEKMRNDAFLKIVGKQESVAWQEVMGKPKYLEVAYDTVTLEGYQVHSHEHRTTKELSITFYFGVVSESVQEHIEEVLKKVLPNHSITFITATTMFSVLENICRVAKSQRSLLLEITGEMTSVALLEKGILRGVKTLSFGTNHLLKIIAPNAVTFEEAQTSLEIFKKKYTKKDGLASLPHELQDALRTWEENVMSSVHFLLNGKVIPTDTGIVVDPLLYKFYATIINEPKETLDSKQVIKNTTPHLLVIPQEKNVEKKEKSTSTTDVRFILLTYVLPFYIQEKGMWYTN